MSRHELFGQIATADPRHHNVGKQQVNRTVVVGSKLNCGLGIVRL